MLGGSRVRFLTTPYRNATSLIENLVKVNQHDLLLKNTEIQEELVSQRTTADRRFLQQMDVIDGVKTNIGNLTSISKVNVDRLGVIERRQNRDSIVVMKILEFMEAMVLR